MHALCEMMEHCIAIASANGIEMADDVQDRCTAGCRIRGKITWMPYKYVSFSASKEPTNVAFEQRQ
jgi:hypothetical protein